MELDLETLEDKEIKIIGLEPVTIHSETGTFIFKFNDKTWIQGPNKDVRLLPFRFPSLSLKWLKFWLIQYKGKFIFLTSSETPDFLKFTKKNFTTFEEFVDKLIDTHTNVFEHISMKLEIVEQKVIFNNNIKISDLHLPKRNLISQRKALKTLKEVTVEFVELREPRLVRIMDIVSGIDVQREISDELLNLILSVSSQKTNDVMRVLTVISTIFMPLTFLVGVYGMNFKHLPELDWYYGYYVIWAVMLSVTGVMIYFFKKKHWI